MQSLKRRKVLEAIAAGFGATLLAGCGCGSDSGPAPNPPPPPAPCPDCWVVYPNSCDPRILALIPGSGGRFSLVGTKSASGDIECAHRLVVIDAAENLSTVEFVPAENKLIATNGGASMSVCPINGGNWGVSLLAGCEQLEVSVTPLPGDIPVGQQAGAPRAGRHVQLSLQEHACSACTGQALAAASVAPMADIAVSGCAGVNSDAFVYLRDENAKLLDVAVADAAGDNGFTAFLTDSNTPGESFSAAVSKTRVLIQSFDTLETAFVSVLSNLKSTSAVAVSNSIIATLKSQGRFSEFCDQFASAIGAAGVVSEEQKLARAAAFFTKMLGTFYLAVEFHDRLQQPMSTDLLNAYSQYQSGALKLQAAMTAEDATRFAGPLSGPVAPGGPFPILALDTGRDVAISRIALEPARPSAWQDYVASGVLSCLQPGDSVTVSVAGTDGFSDAAFFVVGAQGSADFALAVPGTPAGVRDMLTVTVQRGGAELARRTASQAPG